ncbi:MAG: outer membrane protein assembly factor BamA [Pseudomonadota bacterium]
MNKILWVGMRFCCRMRRGAGSALVAMALVLCAFMTSGAAKAQTFQFTTFAVEGNQRVDAATVLSYAEITPGSTVTEADLNRAFQDILASGLFETAELVPRGNTLLIRVQEFPTVNLIAFEGNRRLDDEELLTLISSTPRRVFSPTQAEQDAAAIVTAYETQGLLAATVRARIIRRSENRVDLVFEITEGRFVENQRVSFIGNRAFTDRRLRRVLETKQAGVFRALFRSDSFIADRLEFDQTLLRDFYNSRGYVDFEVVDVAAELSRERNATFLTFQIREGQQFRIGTVTSTSEITGADPAEFLDAGRLREGVVYSPILIENAITRMEGLATQKGLDFLRIEPRVTRNDRELTLDIEFALSRGPRVFVERIDIEGNQTTLDRVIRRQFRVVEGDPFDPREIRNAATRIRALNFFEVVDVNSREGSGEDQVIIDVDVTERPTGTLGVGASFATDSGFGVFLNFSEANFLGRGQRLSFDIATTGETANSEISFFEPALLGRDLGLGLSLFRRTTDDNNADYDTTSTGFRGSLTFPIGEFTRLQTRYTFSLDEVEDVEASSSPIIVADLGEQSVSSIGYTWSYDTRTSGLDPNAGVFLSFSQDFAGVGGDVSYVRSVGRAVAQRRLRNEAFTLRATFEAGNLTMLDDDVSRLTDRFFLSSSQMRGFEFRGVGPRDVAAANEDALGGLNFAVARFEYGFPLGFVEDLGVSGGLFLDMGSVWSLDNTDGAAGPGSVDDEFSLRAAAGFSLFWDTPIGPLTFNFSEPLRSEEFDIERSFDVALTARF